MKTLKTFLILGFTALIAASCGSSKDTATNTRGKSNTQVVEQTTDGKTSKRIRQSMDVKSESSRVTQKGDDYNLGKIQPMYAEVNMGKEQINRFERDWKKSIDSWKRNNPNKTMNNYERVENQDHILRDILDDTQLERYQQWVVDNADGE